MAPLRNSGSPVLIALAVTLAAGILLGLAPFPHRSSVFAARRSAAAKNNPPAAHPAQNPDARPVIVELFTSEGCSSCPPADALLAHLQQDQPVASANIITLEEHVDYWDHLGWKDRFSSPSITQRQRAYQSAFGLDDVYTPQFVVNGSSQFDGTNPSAINTAIAKSAANTISLQIESVRVRYGMEVFFKLAPAPAVDAKQINIYAAVIEPQDVTSVKKGENTGRTLHHVDAVRAMTMVAAVSHTAGLDKNLFSVRLPGGSKLVAPRLVVFAQASGSGPILGSAIHTITAKEIEPVPAPNSEIQLPSQSVPSFPSPGGGDCLSAACGMPPPPMNVP